ncbi:peptidase [Chitinophaga agrisoli]|uniref:Peptidase n=2 Tax=Chitinophaga agrisoli TaxID=2607653 RepID=A0A5B2VN31_9BACT|nr:peptidase [Chitinophaga agrisoli]
MIKTIKHKGLRLLWEGEKGYRLPADQVERIEDMLEVIDSAVYVPADFEFYKSWKIHPLKGNLKGYWSLTVKENWRVIFCFDREHAYNLDYIDYH